MHSSVREKTKIASPGRLLRDRGGNHELRNQSIRIEKGEQKNHHLIFKRKDIVLSCGERGLSKGKNPHKNLGGRHLLDKEGTDLSCTI